MNYEIQFARITNAGRLPDRFLACQHFEADDLTKSSMGKIFSLVEIISPWFPTVQTGQKICQNFAKYYFQGGSTSDVVNIENSLKNLNEDLGQITQSGETDWVGNLNTIFAVISEGNLHLAPAGKVEAYLFRDGKINHLTSGLAQVREAHPLKTFANTVSGELKIHDKILLSTSGLFSWIPLDTIQQIITLNSPQEAAMQICRILRKEKVKNINLIIINLLSKEKLSSEPIRDLENVYYLDKQAESSFTGLNKILGAGKDNLIKGFQIISSGIKKILKIIPRAKKPPKITPTATPKTNEDRFQKEFISDIQRDDGLLKDEEIKYSPDLYVHYYQNQPRPKTFLKTSKLVNFFSILGGLFNSFFNWLLTTYRDKKRRRFLYIILAIILIFIIILVILLKNRQGKVGNLEAQKILDTAIAAQKEGLSLKTLGDEDEAKEKFVLSITEANKIKDNLLVEKDANETIANSLAELDKLTATTRFNNLKPILTIQVPAKQLYVISGQAYMVTENEILEGNIIGGTPSKTAELGKGQGNFLSGTKQDRTIFLYTNNQNLYQFDSSSKSLEQAKIADGRWETANSIAYYSNTLYLLDGVLGQIYKHSSTQDSFLSGQEYISTESINLKDSFSLAIDGSIFILKHDGQVIKLQKSKKQEFSLQNIPAPFEKIAQPLKIFTDTDTPYIYILDGGNPQDDTDWQTNQPRILEFDKEGLYIHQYILSEELKNITDFVVSSKLKKIWLIEEKNLYEIPI